jgi:hypothetical protein
MAPKFGRSLSCTVIHRQFEAVPITAVVQPVRKLRTCSLICEDKMLTSNSVLVGVAAYEDIVGALKLVVADRS